MCKLDVEAAGGKYVDFEAFSKNVHVDGNIVSAPAYP
jgi:putative intracellular protease/amidase